MYPVNTTLIEKYEIVSAYGVQMSNIHNGIMWFCKYNKLNKNHEKNESVTAPCKAQPATERVRAYRYERSGKRNDQRAGVNGDPLQIVRWH